MSAGVGHRKQAAIMFTDAPGMRRRQRSVQIRHRRCAQLQPDFILALVEIRASPSCRLPRRQKRAYLATAVLALTPAFDENAPHMSQRPHQAPGPLDELMARAEGYANFAMRKIGHVPPALIADSPKGPLHFSPSSLADERAKNTFANTARLVCMGYSVTAAVLVLESWIKVAKPGEKLDPTEPPSESIDRREAVLLMTEHVPTGTPAGITRRASSPENPCSDKVALQ